MGSRILGYFRDVLTASLLGTGAAADALVVALKLPSLFRRLFAEGALNAAFVPMFAEILAKEGKNSARSFAEEVLSVLIIILAVLLLLIELFMPEFLSFYARGFQSTPERFELAIQFCRITFPFIFFISITALYSGILNSLEKFAAVASSPLVGNFFIIAFVLAVNPFLHTPGPLLAAGIFGCGIIQLLWVLVPAYKNGMWLKLQSPRKSKKVGKLIILMMPVLLSSGVHQINVIIGTIIASYLPVGGVTYLYYAERLTQLPLSVIGTAMSTVLLPLMASQLRTNKREEAMGTQNQGLEFAMLLVLPATIGLIFLAQPIIQVMFEHGAFDAEASKQTAYTLMAFAIGLPAFVLTKIFSTSFYAQQDTMTPLYFAILSVAVDVSLSLLLYTRFAHVGIAFSTAMAAWVYAICLGYKLWSNGFLKFDARLRKFIPRSLVACSLTVITLEAGKIALRTLANGAQMGIALSALVLVGLLSYIYIAKLVGALDINELKSQFSKQEDGV